jgi:alpha-tubulin suppressor-like RCC1 family protein
MFRNACTVWIALATASLASCVGDPADDLEVARAVARIAVTPAGVRCIRVEVRYPDGSTQGAQAEVTPGAASRIDLGVLSPGAATVSGVAWNDGCPKGVGATPSWVTDPRTVTLVRGAFQDVQLVFVPNSRTSLTADFRIPARAIAVGGATTYALMADGTVRAWGFNDAGQTGTASRQSFVPRPAPVERITGARAITAGAEHACVITEAGDALCWGDNTTGQLGVAGITRSYLPVAPSGLGRVAQLAAGGFHTCGLVEREGTYPSVWCWGFNAVGQLGIGSTERSSLPRESVGAMGTVTQLRATGDSTCALNAIGRVWCAGGGGLGTFGVSAVGPFRSWTETGFPFAEQHAPGPNRACVITPSAQVVCAGLGVTVNVSGRPLFTDTGFAPRPLVGLTNVTQVAASVSCALRADGTVWCFGPGVVAASGDPTMRAADLAPRQVPGLSGVTQIAAGSTHVCALRSDGSVWCWGSNNFGELGDGTFMTSYRPVQAAL